MHKNPFITWLPLAAAISVLSMTMYITGQQMLRMTADDLPRQIASNIAAQLEAGKTPAEVMPSGTVELGTSYGPFVMIYADGDYVPTTNNARINGQPIVPPAGVINLAHSHTHSVTWQPRYGTRLALTAWRADSGIKVVVVGQSLWETEAHIQLLGYLVLFGWGVAMVVSLGLAWAMTHFTSRSSART